MSEEISAAAIALQREVRSIHNGFGPPYERRAKSLQIIDRYLREASLAGCTNGIRIGTEQTEIDIQERLAKAREEGRNGEAGAQLADLGGGTYIRECAEKAVLALAKANYISKNVFPDKPTAIICEAFGVQSKDWMGQAAERIYLGLELDEAMEPEIIRAHIEAAWKIAKGEK